MIMLDDNAENSADRILFRRIYVSHLAREMINDRDVRCRASAGFRNEIFIVAIKVEKRYKRPGKLRKRGDDLAEVVGHRSAVEESKLQNG